MQHVWPPKPSALRAWMPGSCFSTFCKDVSWRQTLWRHTVLNVTPPKYQRVSWLTRCPWMTTPSLTSSRRPPLSKARSSLRCRKHSRVRVPFGHYPESWCNRVHLHIVFVLLYSVCRSCLCSFVCVRHSIFDVCVACCDLDVTIRLRERAREKASRIRPLECTIRQERRNKIRSLWLWFVCYSLLPTCYFHRLFTLLWLGQPW